MNEFPNVCLLNEMAKQLVLIRNCRKIRVALKLFWNMLSHVYGTGQTKSKHVSTSTHELFRLINQLK